MTLLNVPFFWVGGGGGGGWRAGRGWGVVGRSGAIQRFWGLGRATVVPWDFLAPCLILEAL